MLASAPARIGAPAQGYDRWSVASQARCYGAHKLNILQYMGVTAVDRSWT